VSDFRESFGNVATDMRGVSHETLTLAPAEVQKICAKAIENIESEFGGASRDRTVQEY
jgi:hypothetical protein